MIADDVIDLFVVLDENGLTDELPDYVARNITRIPQVKLEDSETCVMAKKLEEQKRRMREMEEREFPLVSMILGW